MPKQLNVNLAFTADTAQAKRQIQELQRSLQDLSSNMVKNSGLSKMSDDILKAQQSVLKLNSILSSSLNADTGRLDLSKFNQQLGSAGMSIQSLATDMSAFGADGQKAFLNLANSIVTTQKPMVETNKLLDGMWTALKNTARWQLSSSLLHGFMGAIQGAYGYAQDLNKSLTDIAIVTGRSTDQMAEFAEQANKSAQALSVSTTAYTDAALIYYQQGLDDAAVKARTDVTMMMSNVTGESAEHVSSYMTAIWNNFEDGSKSLEYYADVITALGAATASSSEEIANGMQQFAAVADTVGLSYEYAATALATVVAQTRQSESTVGNSFRTIFSRLQGLKLGETLEDGTDLNKYSKALETVGVSIKDQNGNLKEMDTILDEIGAKWQTLTKDQQVALAQTVGGVRQYTNLIALFDNWDTFQKNLGIAEGSEGTLAKQADIYAQSWEAAQKRVKAAWQAIYQDLIDSDFFIGLLNNLEKVLKGIDLFIDSVGGIPGVLSVIGVAVTGLFGDKILAGIQKAQQQLKVMTGVAKQESDYIVEETKASLDKLVPYGSEDSADAMRVQSLKDQVDLNYQLKGAIEELAAGNKHLTESQREHLNSLIETTQQYGEAAAKAREYQEAASTKLVNTRLDIKASILDNGKDTSEGSQFMYDALSGENKLYNNGIKEIANLQLAGKSEEAEKATWNLIKALNGLAEGSGVTAKQLTELVKDSVDLKIANEQSANAAKNYAAQLTATKVQIEAEKRAVQDNISIQEAQKQVIQENINKTQETLSTLEAKKEKTEEDTKAIEENKAALESLNNMMNQTNNAPTQNFNTGIYSAEFAQNLTNIITMISRITMAFNSLKSAWDAIQDPNLSSWEKFTRVITSLGMALPILFKTFSQGKETILSLGDGIKLLATKILAKTAATTADTASETANVAATAANAAAKTTEAGAASTAAAANMSLGAALKIVTLESLKFLATPIGIALMSLGLIATGVAMGFKEMQENSPEGQLEKISQEAEEAHKQLDEVKQKYDDLNSSLQSYKDLQVSIHEMDEADRARVIAEQNEELRELILSTKNWKDIFEDGIQYDDSGLIKITEAQEEQLKKMALQEESLARQLALEKDIAKEEANRVVEDKKSDAKKITVTETKHYEGQGGSTAATAGGDYTTTTDVTRKIADALAGANIIDLQSADGKVIEEALRNAGFDGAQLNEIMNQLGAIKTDNELANQWNSLIAEHTGYLENLDAQKEAYARESLGSEALTQASPFGEVQDAIVQDFLGLTDEQQQTIRDAVINEGKTLEEAWVEAGANLEQTIADSTTQMRMDLLDNVMKASDLQGNAEGQQEVVDWFNSLNEEELKILGTLEIDKDASFEEIKAQVEAISHEITFEVDADVDEKELETLTEYLIKNADAVDENGNKIGELDDHLKTCTSEAKKVAHAILRFNDAIEDVTKNYDKWNKALKSDNMMEQAEAAAEMQDAYGDLLDIDGSVLSSQFLENAKNLDLMKEAANGSESAYKELQEAANQDIIAHCDVDTTAFDAAMENIQQYMKDVEFDKLEVGADLNDEGFLQELGNLVNAAHMTEEEATAYLANMGIDAEVKKVPAKTGTVQSDRQYWVPAEYEAGAPIQTGGEDEPSSYTPLRMTKAGHWESVDETHQEEESPAAFALEVTSAHKSSGGGFKMANASAPSGGGSKGGGCFAAGTLITLQNKYKNIEDIEVGDIVLSYNEKTKKNVFNKVLQRMVHIVKEKIYSLFIRDEELTVTGIHRFLITRDDKQEWIQASELQEGDLVLLADGTLQEISNINIKEKALTVYNFEVSNTHNYYVGENQILAHNKGKKGGGGKGSSKKAKTEKPKEKKKNIKEEDRYHNIKEKIDDLNKSMDRLNKNKDRAYGKDRIKYMQEEINKTKEQIGLTKDYIKEINKYRKVDRANLDKVLGKGWKDLNTGKLVGGLNLKNPDDLFDADGILKNYEELFNTIQDRFDQTATKTYNKAVDEYNKAVAKFNKDQNQDAFDKAKEKMEAAEEEYQKQNDIYKQQIDYLKQYEETMNLWQEKQQERIDQMNELLDKELELTQHKIELRLEVADDERSKLEWLYDNLGDSADRAADRIANLGQQARVANKNIDTYLHALTNELEDIKDWEGYTKAGTKVSLKNLIESGELDYDINDPDSILNAFQKINNYITKDWIGAELPMEKILEDFAKYRDGLMDEYSNLKEIADTVEEQLIGAFEEWNEKLDDNLSLFDHYDIVIDTYKEIADLLGSDALGFDPDLDMSYQRAKLSNQQQAARFAKDAYDEAINERIKAQERLANATSDIEKKAAEEYLKLCEETERERQEEFLARTRDALRQAQELFEKTIENNQKVYLKSLGGGTPNLGILQNQLDMNKELNDLYLDDYEKYKKLGDLQNNINKQLAKNPNVKVQGKLNDLLDDVNSKMAAGVEISEGEATILEKRLQLLQAEDQLMAARNAKSAVRMTRDNEGNFSYTYTADTSKIEEAQQNYADKFYDLLDYEKQYSQEVQDNILQAMQDFNDKAAEIMEDGTLSEAEKKVLLQQLDDQCKMKVKFYTDQMQIVTDEMTRFKNDDWADMEQTLGRMLASDSDFETNFNETTLGKIAPAWNEAKDAMVDFVSAADTLVDNSIGAMNKLLVDNETTMKLVDSSTEAFAENYTGLLQDVVDKSVAAAEAGESLVQTMSDSLNEVLDETKAYYEEYGKELDDLFERINKVTNVINQFRANWNGEATYEVATTDTGRAGANPSTVSMSNPSEGVNNPTDRFTSTFAGQPVITSVSGTTLPNSTSAELVGDNSEWLNSVINKAMIKYDSLLSMNKSQTVAGNNNVVINADFPNVESYEEIAKAFETLINSASQYANENNG